ncbi:MAG: ATP-dependent sacrificial sulfur transferase LarE [Oscillospiraceae bacterium]|nr:ATP-dependent sacrificial sulfur transferase LarE [Oscillospiraceae bacterium]
MNNTLYEKQAKLKELLLSYGNLAVAFSGGVDSTFLLQTAHDVLGDRALAVTAAPVFVPPRELQEAKDFCRSRSIRQIVIPAEALNIDSVRHNPPDRCYHCKHEIFGNILRVAGENGISFVAEGSNTDDVGDYRPGMRAIRELGVKSPLLEAGLSKEDIRALSREMGLPTWDKPSFACLASRFVYGERITDERLSMVDRAEQLLMDLGFRQFRVRIHGDLARIELLPEDLEKLIRQDMRERVYRALKEYGFSYVTLDLAGYRTGSMNETILRNTAEQA